MPAKISVYKVANLEIVKVAKAKIAGVQISSFVTKLF